MLSQGRPDDAVEEPERAAIRQEVKDFLSGHPLRFHDADDLEQECLLAWWSQRPLFDPSRASMPTFLKLVVRKRLQDLLKQEYAKGREGARSALSLNRPLSADSDVELGDSLPGADGRAEDLRLGVASAVGRMTQRQQAIVRGARDGYTATAIAKAIGISRDTLYEDFKRIRAAFREEGLRD